MKEHRLDLHSIIYSNILNSTISIDSLVNFYWLLLKVQNIASEFTYCAKCYGGICRKQGKTIGKTYLKHQMITFRWYKYETYLKILKHLFLSRCVESKWALTHQDDA